MSVAIKPQAIHSASVYSALWMMQEAVSVEPLQDTYAPITAPDPLASQDAIESPYPVLGWATRQGPYTPHDSQVPPLALPGPQEALVLPGPQEALPVLPAPQPSGYTAHMQDEREYMGGQWMYNNGWTGAAWPCLKGWLFIQGWWDWRACLSWHVQKSTVNNQASLHWQAWVWHRDPPDSDWKAYMLLSEEIPPAEVSTFENYKKWMIHEEGDA